MKAQTAAAIGVCSAVFTIGAAAQAHFPRPGGPHDPGYRRPIDLVICLDTSNSMDGLIDSARARLWDIVSQLGKVQPTPYLRVGLLTYGSPNVSTPAAGWVLRQSDLTSDLDMLYSRMMSLRTNGGDEFVGWVLRDAVQTMTWSNDPNALKLIFVAGNESADQDSGRVNFRNVAEMACARGITINSIYCGNESQGRQEAWHEVAMHGHGTFSAIDMQCGTVQIQTPYDKPLMELNIQLNATYIPFGQRAAAGVAAQHEQDAAANRLGAQTCGSRVAAKASGVYENAQWDLVDAAKQDDFRIEKVADADLPRELQQMPAGERKEHVEKMRNRRGDVQKQIQDINAQREEFLRKEQARQSGGKTSLDAAMQQAIRQQAEAKGFKFEGN